MCYRKQHKKNGKPRDAPKVMYGRKCICGRTTSNGQEIGGIWYCNHCIATNSCDLKDVAEIKD